MNSLVYIIQSILSADFLFTVLRVTTPILFAAMAAVICTKTGVVNIALEGVMLSAALFGVIGSGFSGSLWVGLISAIAGGLLISLLLAYFSLKLDTDIVLAGIALNLLAVGGTVFLLNVVSGDRGSSTSIPSLQFPKINIPFVENIPFLGQVLSGHNILTYVAFLMVLVVSFFLHKTVLGLRFQSVGENPDAASSVGINVKKTQLLALVLSGIVASLGGAYMSMGYLSHFSNNMISGRGYIAMAAEAMGQATPFGTLISSLIFGAAESMSHLMQALAIPSEIIRMVPYISTILGLIIYSQINKRNQIKKKRKLEGEIK